MHRLILILTILFAQPAFAETQIRQIDTQFIAALGSPTDTHGSNAEKWGL